MAEILWYVAIGCMFLAIIFVPIFVVAFAVMCARDDRIAHKRDLRIRAQKAVHAGNWDEANRILRIIHEEFPSPEGAIQWRDQATTRSRKRSM